MIVRASQVIPVYPLTEDLQPGDIFLVQLPIDRQQELYQQQGFLALDNMIRRVNPRKYQGFYERSFDVGGEGKWLPKFYLSPGANSAPWSLAPIASFPTYSFSVRSGGGFNLALPVQGVPIGLSLLGGDAAQGTLTIADARTYGIDTASLYDDVREWARENYEFLSHFEPTEKRHNYLRVVSRVYLAGRLNVSLQSSKSSGAAASGGVSKPVELVMSNPSNDPKAATIESYKNNVSKLNSMIDESMKKATPDGLAGALPGGTVKVVSASARSISLVETFDRPLVIGYMGFDMAIGEDGALGPPIPTHAVLKDEVRPTLNPTLELLSNAALRRSYTILTERQVHDEQARRLVEELDQLEKKVVPDKYPCAIFGFRDTGAPLSILHKSDTAVPRDSGKFPVVTMYRGTILSSIDDLKQAQSNKDMKIEGFDQ